MKKYPLIFPKSLHTEPSNVKYGGRIIRFKVTVIEGKTIGMNCNYKFHCLQKADFLQL